MLTPGQEIELVVEKPAAGGRMIARGSTSGGQVVLVGGAVPGERVIARVDRIERHVAFASTVDVREASADRRVAFGDPLCGGCVYSHIAYSRQLAIKADVIGDAFRRIGRRPLEAPVSVGGSPETEYRMRARLHVDRGRIGFYREGTHTLCDAGPTRQLSEEALSVVSAAVAALRQADAQVTSVELAENIPADQRALAFDLTDAGTVTAKTLEAIVGSHRVRGCVTRDQRGARLSAGEPSVADAMRSLTHGRIERGALHRHPESFFQANRFLIADLVTTVLDAVPEEGAVLDLYSGVGVFSLALAGSGRRGVTAVEGDRTSGIDLQRNAGQVGGAVGTMNLVLDSVEAYLDRHRGHVDTIIVDPPRTGISRRAAARIAELKPHRVVYVSCDPATMARDARRLIDAGYALDSLRGFDLFPNTPHVETVGVFVHRRTGEREV